ncbi:Uncharacterised protein r2_g3195 [Pycnogonum litorale]
MAIWQISLAKPIEFLINVGGFKSSVMSSGLMPDRYNHSEYDTNKENSEGFWISCAIVLQHAINHRNPEMHSVVSLSNLWKQVSQSKLDDELSDQNSCRELTWIMGEWKRK